MTKKSDWCIYTAFDANYRDIARVSVPTMRAYAAAISADFRVFEFNASGRHPAWAKIKFAQQLLQEFTHVLWVDADAVFTRTDIDIRLQGRPEKYLWAVAHPTPLHPQRGYCGINGAVHFNTGFMVLVRSEWTNTMINELWSSPAYIQQPFWEQSALNQWLGLHSGVQPWLDLDPVRPPDAPRTDRLRHVLMLNLNWNSVPGLLMGRDPVVHHYLALDPSVRYQAMHQDQVLRNAVRQHGLSGAQATEQAIDRYQALIRTLTMR